jgi:RHS repeat-associated protein
LTKTYDRVGRPGTDLRNGITTTYGYNGVSELLTESYSGGTLGGLSISSGYDSLLRKTNVMVTGFAGTMNGYAYDNASRLSMVSDGTNSATYSYLANSPLVSQILFKQAAATRITTTQQYDYLNRLQQISAAPSGGQLGTVYAYQYNAANQRIVATLADNSQWKYGYDSLGQVISGKKNWSNQGAVPSEQFEYTFDDIGNRTATKMGGDSSGLNLRPATYSPNTLNQYTTRTVSGSFDVIGIVNGAATVTVNGQAPYRKGEFFDSVISVNNVSVPVYQAVTVSSTHGVNNGSQVGSVYVPPATESFAYDLDGNLTTDGRWQYTWDGENRLVQMIANPNISVPTGARLKLVFEYDAKGRRTRKQVYTWNTGTSSYNSTVSIDLKFLYDGWNLLAELNGANSLQRAYLWGSDLSRSMQGAGGVGGLIAMKSSVGGAHFAAYDGNGNVMALVDAALGTYSARYEYGPFGELLRATGPQAKTNPFRFSTKIADDEGDLVYYGHRYYMPSSGRFLNSDPVHEIAFQLALVESGRWKPSLHAPDHERYTFVRNDPLSKTDFLGLAISSIDAALEACLKNPNPVARVKCLEDYYDTLGGDELAKKKVKQFLCNGIVAAYKAADKLAAGCDVANPVLAPGETKCQYYAKRAAAMFAEISGRMSWITMGCGTCDKGHDEQLANKWVSFERCAARATTACAAEAATQ